MRRKVGSLKSWVSKRGTKFFNIAIKWGRATSNPVKEVKFAKEDNGRIRFLTYDEESRLIPACKELLRPVVITALHTGFRLSELLSLMWDDVDFMRRIIQVRAGYAKNGESRSIPMNEVLTATLEGIRISNGVVFRNRKGTPYRSVRTTFENAVKRAEIEDFIFHDLRHTFASRLVMAGVDLSTVKRLMGHKDISMTLRYAHLSDNHMQRAVDFLVPPFFTTCPKSGEETKTRVIDIKYAPVAQLG